MSVSGLRVGSAGKLGRGVFATQRFECGSLIERAPLIVIQSRSASLVVQELTVLGAYCYQWDEDRICLALGYASLYNHSSRPNAVYFVRDDVIEIFALRDINPGTQIKINYNGDPDDKTPINWGEWGRGE